VPAVGNDPRFFRFFHATAQALFLYRALERTVEYDLEDEIHYLITSQYDTVKNDKPLTSGENARSTTSKIRLSCRQLIMTRRQ
jgi:hypothetical protein